MTDHGFNDGVERRLVYLCGVLVLLIGVLVYVFARGGYVYFVPEILRGNPTGSVTRHLTNQLPTFLHTFAFATFMASIWSSIKHTALLACLGVVIIELVFEIGQHSIVAQYVATHFPIFLVNVPIIGLTPEYFARGTFDLWDLLSILIGGALAALVILRSYRWRN